MVSIEEITKFCKEKGFVFSSAEIYGSLAGFWDFGHLGVELKNNIKSELWKSFVTTRDDIIGMDGSIITNPQVWKASGHIDSFKDKNFNLMFQTSVGADKTAISSYLRPETAQLIFTNFKLLQEAARKKLPFGIAQTGKAFRNEISPREFLFRSREFEQFEIEYFIDPDKKDDCPVFDDIKKIKVNMITADEQKKKSAKHKETTINELVNKKVFKNKWIAYWIALSYKWFLDLGISKENLRLREHKKDELAHYAVACFDIEYNFPFGWKEIYGCADRKDFDLKQHIKNSSKDLTLFDDETKNKIIPYVVAEPSQGIERTFLAFLFEAYYYDKKRGNIVLNLDTRLTPIKAGVFPLVNKLSSEAKKLYSELKKHISCIYDQSGSIGRRYARADEIGIPYCITVDFDTIKDKKVTIRHRNTTKQERIEIVRLKERLQTLLG